MEMAGEEYDGQTYLSLGLLTAGIDGRIPCKTLCPVKKVKVSGAHWVKRGRVSEDKAPSWVCHGVVLLTPPRWAFEAGAHFSWYV